MSEFSHELGDATGAFRFDQADGKPSETRDIFGAIAGVNTAAVFVINPIEDVVTAIFNAPVTAISEENLLRVCLIRGLAGDAINDFLGTFSGLFFYEFPFDDKGLADVGEVEVGIEFGGGPDFTGFDPSVIWGRRLDKIRSLSILKEAIDILEQGELVFFDDKVVMSLSFLNQIASQFPLGQQGIGRNQPAFNINV